MTETCGNCTFCRKGDIYKEYARVGRGWLCDIDGCRVNRNDYACDNYTVFEPREDDNDDAE